MLLTIVDKNKSSLARKLTETRMPMKHCETPMLQATNDSLPSNPLLLPRTLTPNTVRTFIKLLTPNGKTINPTCFTHIANLNTYQQALGERSILFEGIDKGHYGRNHHGRGCRIGHDHRENSRD